MENNQTIQHAKQFSSHIVSLFSKGATFNPWKKAKVKNVVNNCNAKGGVTTTPLWHNYKDEVSFFSLI